MPCLPDAPERSNPQKYHKLNDPAYKATFHEERFEIGDLGRFTFHIPARRFIESALFSALRSNSDAVR
jgi:3-hydroxy-3-methylglutaryl CoA synthase